MEGSGSGEERTPSKVAVSGRVLKGCCVRVPQTMPKFNDLLEGFTGLSI